MPEPFKNLINAEVVRAAGLHLHRTSTRFDRARFESLALAGLDALEMKGRAMQIATALEATLPADFAAAAEHIESALGPPGEGDDLGVLRMSDQGLSGWIVWSLGEFVARKGLADVPRALRCLHALTQRFSAEFAIRPFIAAQPERVFDTLHRWTADRSAHVRRLVSEGSRPRLPWGLQLKSLIADPSPTLPLLAALQDDSSPYVRRSVANHLNDIAKDHPALVVQWVQRHLVDAPADRVALLRHASRTLVKRGDGAMLQAWGLGAPFKGKATLAVSPRHVRIGDVVELHLVLQSAARRAQPLAIDYVVHHARAAGGSSAKVFKGWVLDLAAGAALTLVKKHSMRPVTTRRYHPGLHRAEVQINGALVAEASFDLLP